MQTIPPVRRLAVVLAFLLPTLPSLAFTDADWVSFIGMPPSYATADAPIRAMALAHRGFYVAGGFTGSAGSYIARWDGANWSTVAGISNNVYALAVIGTVLYAAGDFTSVGGIPVNCIAKYQNGRWWALGNGLSGSLYNPWTHQSFGPGVSALAVVGTNLYAAGSFTQAGGVAANLIAKWDGLNWTNLGSGLAGGLTAYPSVPSVYSMAVSGTNLYVAGYFSQAGAVSAHCIAKWDGNTWSSFGLGGIGVPSGSLTPYWISSVTASGNDVYVAGSFTNIGGISALNAARWNGSAWTGLGTNISSVNALSAIGSMLYAGGSFTTAGGVTANHIAQWDGAAWSPLGSGLNNAVATLLSDGAGHLLVGGDFTRAGTNSASYIVQANVGPGIFGGRMAIFTYPSVTGLCCSFSNATPGEPYRIQTRSSLTSGIWTDFTNFTYTAPLTFTNPASGTNTYYRAISP